MPLNSLRFKTKRPHPSYAVAPLTRTFIEGHDFTSLSELFDQTMSSTGSLPMLAIEIATTFACSDRLMSSFAGVQELNAFIV